MDGSKIEVNRVHSLFFTPCLSLIRRGRRLDKLGEEQRKERKEKKSPDQGAVVTMATVSAPASLELGEGVGLLHPSVPPTLTATSPSKAHNPELCPLEEASGHRGQWLCIWPYASSFKAGGQPTRGKLRSLLTISRATVPSEHAPSAFWPLPCC